MERTGTQSSSYDELRSLVEGLVARVELLEAENAELRADNTRLRTENAALKRKLGGDSTNSSTPPSQDSLAAKGERRAQRSQRVRSKDRKRGGQPGHKGSGLTPAVTPDRTETASVPEDCSGCGADLADDAGGRDAGSSWTQIWDIPPVRLEKVRYVLPRRRCGGCGKTTTAVVSFGQAGAVVYGPNVNAAAILLASAGNVPVERTAMLMAALLASPVSTGFVARAHERLTEKLAAAGFDAAMSAALATEPVLCGDETPVNVLGKDTDEHGEPVPGAPHVVTIRTPEQRLVWYRALPARTKKALRNLGLLGDYTGYLVRDDYVAWHQFDNTAAGVQQCVAHYADLRIMPMLGRKLLPGMVPVLAMSALSEAFEEGEKGVGGPVAPGCRVRWCGSGECLFFEDEIGV